MLALTAAGCMCSWIQSPGVIEDECLLQCTRFLTSRLGFPFHVHTNEVHVVAFALYINNSASRAASVALGPV